MRDASVSRSSRGEHASGEDPAADQAEDQQCEQHLDDSGCEGLDEFCPGRCIPLTVGDGAVRHVAQQEQPHDGE